MVKHAIFHEGNSKKSMDNSLIKLLIEHLGYDITDIRFYGVGSKSNFFKISDPNYQDLQQMLQANQIDSALFVVDADNASSDVLYGGFDNTQERMQQMLNTLNINDVSDIYISCDPETKEGYLESLILSSIPTPHKECIESFLACSQFQSKDNAKAVLNHIYRKAYPSEPYNFSHSNFDILKTKINWLFGH